MAIYKFLTDKDLDLGMKKYWRDQITNGDTNKHIMVTCEGASLSMIKTKLNNKYDLLKLFPVIKEWSGTKAYLLDEFCYKSDKIWKAKQAGTNHDPTVANSTYWEEEDPRDQLLVKYAACMTIYFMMESLPPRMVAKEIVDDFAGVMEWLEAVRDGTENPAWDLLESGGSTDIPHGSDEKVDFDY